MPSVPEVRYLGFFGAIVNPTGESVKIVSSANGIFAESIPGMGQIARFDSVDRTDIGSIRQREGRDEVSPRVRGSLDLLRDKGLRGIMDQPDRGSSSRSGSGRRRGPDGPGRGASARHSSVIPTDGRSTSSSSKPKDRVGGASGPTVSTGSPSKGGPTRSSRTSPGRWTSAGSWAWAIRLIGTDDRNRRSFVVRGGKLLPVPEGFVLMAPGRLLADAVVADPLGPGQAPDADGPGPAQEVRRQSDESLASFVRRRLGREALDRLVQPLVGGIYTADPAELSLEATLPQFPAMERDHGSLILGAIRQARKARVGRTVGLGRPLRPVRQPRRRDGHAPPMPWPPPCRPGRSGPGPPSAGSVAPIPASPGGSSCSMARRSRRAGWS